MDFLTFYRSVWNVEYIVQIIVAEALCCLSFKRRRHFVLRAVLSVLCCTGIYILFRLSDKLLIMYDLPGSTSVIKFILMFFITVPALKICFDESLWSILFVAAAAESMQHIGHELSMIFVHASVVEISSLYFFVVQPVVYILAYAALFFLFIRKIRLKEFTNIKNRQMILVIVVCVIVCFCFAWYEGSPIGYAEKIFFALEIVSFCFILLSYQFSFLDNSIAERKNEELERLLAASKREYKLIDEKREIINIKCHDIKKQLRQYGEKLKIDDDSLQEMLGAVNIYDSSICTGNDALDVILLDKSLVCERYNITFGVIVDGAACSFFTPTDMYSLFGNILDNAIEAVTKLSKPEKAVIKLNVRRENRMLIIHCENYFEEPLRFDDGLPVTTKGSRDYHGFGMKSIRLTAEKYGGTMSVSTYGDVFAVNVFIPLAQRSTGDAFAAAG